MGCISVRSMNSWRVGAVSGLGGMSRVRRPSHTPARLASGPRFRKVSTSMWADSVKMSLGMFIRPPVQAAASAAERDGERYAGFHDLTPLQKPSAGEDRG